MPYRWVFLCLEAMEASRLSTVPVIHLAEAPSGCSRVKDSAEAFPKIGFGTAEETAAAATPR